MTSIPILLVIPGKRCESRLVEARRRKASERWLRFCDDIGPIASISTTGTAVDGDEIRIVIVSAAPIDITSLIQGVGIGASRGSAAGIRVGSSDKRVRFCPAKIHEHPSKKLKEQ